MRMPGFTAEASLYQTVEFYELSAGSADRAGAQAIIPQRRRLPTGGTVCICETDPFGNESCKCVEQVPG